MRLPFRKPKPPSWIDPNRPVGAFRGMKGKFQCWDLANGQGEPLCSILADVATHMKEECGRVPGMALMGYNIFMIGENPESAIPHIMFHCPKDKPRKEAVDCIKRSGLLKQYEGLGVGHWHSPPHLPNIQPTADEDGDALHPLLRLIFRSV